MIAASTDLATGLPRRLAERFLTMLPLRIVAIPNLSMRFAMQLVWHERVHADAGASCFRRVVVDAIRAPRRRRDLLVRSAVEVPP